MSSPTYVNVPYPSALYYSRRKTANLPPENWSTRSASVVEVQVRRGAPVDLDFPVHAGADSLRPAAGGERHACGGGLSKDGCRRAVLLPVEEEVRQHGGGGGEAAEGSVGREPQAQAAGCGPEPGRKHLPQDVLPKRPRACSDEGLRQVSTGGLRLERAPVV